MPEFHILFHKYISTSDDTGWRTITLVQFTDEDIVDFANTDAMRDILIMHDVIGSACYGGPGYWYTKPATFIPTVAGNIVLVEQIGGLDV